MHASVTVVLVMPCVTAACRVSRLLAVIGALWILLCYSSLFSSTLSLHLADSDSAT